MRYIVVSRAGRAGGAPGVEGDGARRPGAGRQVGTAQRQLGGECQRGLQSTGLVRAGRGADAGPH